MEENKEKDINRLMADTQGTMVLTKSEAQVLLLYLGRAIVDAEGDYVIGMASRFVVDRLHSIRDKLRAMGKEQWNEQY